MSADDCQLFHITALEFIAVGLNIILWGPLLHGHQVALYSDASTSVQVLISKAAHAPVMQAIHTRILALPEFQALSPSLNIQHVPGEFNVFADAASRNRPQVITALALQLGIPCRQVRLPAQAAVFFQQVRDDAMLIQSGSTAALELEQHRSPAFSSNFAGDGPGVRKSEDSICLQDLSSLHKRPAYIHLPFWSQPSRRMVAEVQSSDTTSVVAISSVPRVWATECSSHATSLPLSGSIPGFHFRAPQGSFSVTPPDSLQRIQQDLLSPPLFTQLGPPQIPRSGLPDLQGPVTLADSGRPLVEQSSLSPLMRTLLCDTSNLGLRPSNPGLVAEFDALVGNAISASVCSGTSKKNTLGMKRWCQFVALWGTPPLREDNPAQLLLNSFLLASFLIWLARELRGKGGRALAKPSTLMGYIYAVKRHHNLHGRRLDAFLLIKPVLRSLNSQYVQRYGPEALQPTRSEPFSGPCIRRLLHACSLNLALPLRDFPVLVQGSWFFHSVRGAIATSARGGHRKGELVLKHDEAFDRSHLSWASLFFIIKGVIYRYPSVEQLSGMKSGDRVGLLPGPCKNDPWGIYFGAHPIYYSFDPDDPASSGVLLRDMARVCRPEASRLRSTPLFTVNSAFQPMRHRHLEATLSSLLSSFLSASEAHKYSWHSFRIGLACALLAAGASDAVIMALCRWRSVSSLRIYARLNPDDYTRFIDDASALNLTSVQGPNLDPIPPQSVSRPAPSILPIPGSLPGHIYDLVDTAMGLNSASLSESRLLQLAADLPELDADGFVSAFNRIDPDREAEGDISDEDEGFETSA